MALSCFINIEDVAQPAPVSSCKSFSQSHGFLAGEWSPTRNCGWQPDDFSVASLVRAWWRCRRGHDEYRLPIASRVFGNKGCPACAALKKPAPATKPEPGQKLASATTGAITPYATISDTNRKVKRKDKVSLAQSNPSLSFEWHYMLNGSLTPDYISARSHKSVWWQCRKNPKHVWQAGIATRCRGGKRCPDCAQESSGRVAS
ncbi:MAG: zinc-ribbon domain-containing protein [Candidatus Obscuribacterales bacterium]